MQLARRSIRHKNGKKTVFAKRQLFKKISKE
jgi:hypothetical protein